MSPRQIALRRIAEARASNASALDLGDLGLDALPTELGDLPALRVLALGQDAIVDDGTGNLQWKYLKNRPEPRLTNLSPLAPLTSLQTLDLSFCTGLTSVDALAALTGLRTLGLRSCTSLTSVNGMVALTGLQKLDLSFCTGLTSVDALAAFTGLQTLEMVRCTGLTSVDGLAALADLRELSLAHCTVLTSVDGLATLTSLQTLELSFCTGLMSVDALAPLTSLQSLNLLSCTGLTSVNALAALTGLQTLNLLGCTGLTSVDALAALTDLRELSLAGCTGLTSVDALAALTGLRKLSLGGCTGLTSVDGLAALTGLKTLNLSGCSSLKRFAPLCRLLPRLTALYLYGSPFVDLHPDVCGNYEFVEDSVLDAVRAHYADLSLEADENLELRVLVLGNGRVGKTQLCNRLRGLPYNPDEESTHGVQICSIDVAIAGRMRPVRLTLWDFGGQDIYHGSHALLLRGAAIFIVVWTPETEGGYYEGEVGSIVFRNRPLLYWLEYIRSLAGTGKPVLIIQGKCDSAHQERAMPLAWPEDFSAVRYVHFSALGDERIARLRFDLEEAAKEVLERCPPPPMGGGRVRVRQRLREMVEANRNRDRPQKPSLSVAAFRRLCRENGPIKEPVEFLRFLHASGEVFWLPEVFGGRIVLNLSWMLDAIYALFHRAKTLPSLFGKGRFTREALAALVWQDRSEADQRALLAMMVSCGMCFRGRLLCSFPAEWEYIAPELLPERSSPEVERDLSGGRIPKVAPSARAEVRYGFVHEGMLRRFLSRIGGFRPGDAVYWKFGCWFPDPDGRGVVVIDSRVEEDRDHPQQGVVLMDAWGDEAAERLEALVRALTELSVGEKPKVVFTGVEAQVASGENRAWSLRQVVVGKNSLPLSDPRGKRIAEIGTSAMLALVELMLEMRPGDSVSSRALAMRLNEQGFSSVEATVRGYLDRLEEVYGKFRSDASKGFARTLLPGTKDTLKRAKKYLERVIAKGGPSH